MKLVLKLRASEQKFLEGDEVGLKEEVGGLLGELWDLGQRCADRQSGF